MRGVEMKSTHKEHSHAVGFDAHTPPNSHLPLLDGGIRFLEALGGHLLGKPRRQAR